MGLPAVIALFGHTGSHASQAMQVSLIKRAIFVLLSRVVQPSVASATSVAKWRVRRAAFCSTQGSLERTHAPLTLAMARPDPEPHAGNGCRMGEPPADVYPQPRECWIPVPFPRQLRRTKYSLPACERAKIP